MMLDKEADIYIAFIWPVLFTMHFAFKWDFVAMSSNNVKKN
jgi:hypothetical protein